MLDDFQNSLLALLFASAEPVTLTHLLEVFPDRPPDALRTSLQALVEEFNGIQKAVEIRAVGGGYRITTLPQHHETVRLFLKVRPSSKLSLAALETLAVIAYKQPITMPEVSEVRGVKGSSTVKTLLEKKLIETRGRKKTIGRPIQYGTTKEFLIHFGLNDLSELPTLKELEEILEDSGEVVTEIPPILPFASGEVEADDESVQEPPVVH